MNSDKPYRFIISGGGTGGHIYPAIAVADEIKCRFPQAEILFVGAEGRMEMTKVPEAGYTIVGLKISGLQRRITLENLFFPFKVLSSYWKALRVLKQFKPHAVLGFGGYASGPVMLAAGRKNIPTLIQEQNSHAGITNKYLGKKAKRICVAYGHMEKYFQSEKIRLTGNPVRRDIIDSAQKREQALDHFNLKADKKTLLVIGGSLGARTINESIEAGLMTLNKADIQVVWQTGKFYYDEIIGRAKDLDLPEVRIYQFIREMDLAYGVADVVISRAGALSVSELALAGKPVIFVPSPNVAEDHQTKNAKAYTAEDAALLVTDKEAPQQLVKVALELLQDTDRQVRIAANIKKLAKPEASKHIVNELMEIIS